MSNMDIMYRAYRELRTAMAEASSHVEMTKALSRADNGNDLYGGTVALREIDMDWVEAIEKAIPYIDAAIRDQRRFIEQEDEIVPIEKSRKITSESVRHLAQHTNMIAKVEGDEVTPASILNIYREESFAIYENRFLHTLLERALDFVEKRYEALCSVSGDSAAQLEMSRIVRVRQEQVRVQLVYETEYREDKKKNVDIAADVSKLSKFQRVLRVRKILSNFMSTPLMRNLSGCEPVRPPIMRTNLLIQNTNFRAVLELWVFLESYTKNGYYTILSESDGRMDPMMKQGFYDVISLTRFVVRMNLNDSIRQELENEYEAENARRAAEAARIEEERKQAEAKKLKMALAEQAAAYEEQIAGLTAEYEAQLAEMKDIYLKQAQEMAAAYEGQLAAQKDSYEEQLSAQQSSYEAQLAEQKDGYESQIWTLTSDYESQLASQKTGYENQIQSLTGGYENQLATQKAQYENQYQETVQRYEARLDDQRQAHEKELDGIKTSCAAEVDSLKEALAAEQSTFEERLAEQAEELSQKQEKEFKELAERYAADADDARAVYEAQTRELQDSHAVEINALSASYEIKIADQAVRHSREVQNLNQKNRRDREANAHVRKELKSLQNECKELKRGTEQLKKQMAQVEAHATKRISRADLWNDIRVRRLKSKLDKALAGYPIEEVKKAGEDLWAMTMDPVFDADDTDSGRFEFYRFEESPSGTGEEPEEKMAEKSTS